ncbi:MAG TPA: helix-turn-helix transcriptional regulator [Rhizomicrobium sp.]|jgi:AraC-like DNA-binding protein|nr:helix-turn-helix transcriptional regulator [Rhizomicrobium sp.]
MSAVKHRPAPPLDKLVECLWWSERNAPLDAVEHMLPTGAAYVVFPLHDLPMACRAASPGREVFQWKRGIAHGPQSGFYMSGPKPAGAVAGIALQPGAAEAIIGIPSSELAGQHVMMNALWGPRADILHERLCEAARPTAVFQILEQELLGRLRQPLLIHPAVAHALQRARRARVRVDDIRRELNLSPRHFIDLFHTAVGLTPGRYYRVRRFARILLAVAQNGPGHMADLAAEAGYSDQSHLIREFREHAGMTPTQYRPVDLASPHHHSAERCDPGGRQK